MNSGVLGGAAAVGLLAVLGAAEVRAQEPVVEFFPAYVTERWTDDLPGMKARRVVRALVTPSLTDFFVDRGMPRGLQAEYLHGVEKALNKGVPRKEQLQIVFIPVPFSELIPALLEGRGDIAAALLTITPEREKQVAFVTGGKASIDEIVVASGDAPPLETLDDLSGREVHVLEATSYYEHLKELAARMKKERKAPLVLRAADPNLSTEDILELVNAGVIQYTVVDRYKAVLWARVLTDLQPYPDIPVNVGGKVGWAVRKTNPQLREALQKQVGKYEVGSQAGNVLINRYLTKATWIKNAGAERDRARFDRFVNLFQKYGQQYGFDWLALNAQAYQESSLDPDARSAAGAVGLMQLLPSTAADMGYTDITDPEKNIAAGAKYMAWIRNKYFDDPALTPENQIAFSWAAYNAGPNRIQKLRQRTGDLGMDADVWFHNVEYVVLEKVGPEPVRYVGNIYKYYVTYKLMLGLEGTPGGTGEQ